MNFTKKLQNQEKVEDYAAHIHGLRCHCGRNVRILIF